MVTLNEKAVSSISTTVQETLIVADTKKEKGVSIYGLIRLASRASWLCPIW